MARTKEGGETRPQGEAGRQLCRTQEEKRGPGPREAGSWAGRWPRQAKAKRSGGQLQTQMGGGGAVIAGKAGPGRIDEEAHQPRSCCPGSQHLTWMLEECVSEKRGKPVFRRGLAEGAVPETKLLNVGQVLPPEVRTHRG